MCQEKTADCASRVSHPPVIPERENAGRLAASNLLKEFLESSFGNPGLSRNAGDLLFSPGGVRLGYRLLFLTCSGAGPGAAT